jgi:hypothetical protein
MHGHAHISLAYREEVVLLLGADVGVVVDHAHGRHPVGVVVLGHLLDRRLHGLVHQQAAVDVTLRNAEG